MDKVDFDALSKAAYADNSTLEEKDALWLALFSLKKWFFIARGNFPNVVPYIGKAPQIEPASLWLYAFTDEDKATEFAKENGLGAEDDSSLFISVPVNRTTIPWIVGQSTYYRLLLFQSYQIHGRSSCGFRKFWL